MPEKQPNIFDLGFDKGLNRVLPDSSTGVVYDYMNSVNTGEMINYGSLNLKSLTIAGSTRFVGPSDDLQAAIDATNRDGGGDVVLFAGTYRITRDIYMKQLVRLRGAGRISTILNFTEGYGLKAKGTSSSDRLQNFFISDLQISGTTGIGIDIDYAIFFGLDNLYINNVGGSGIRIQHAFYWTADTMYLFSSGSHGLEIISDASERSEIYRIADSQAISNAGSGFYVNNTESSWPSMFINCYAQGNNIGFQLAGSFAGYRSMFFGCTANTSTNAGFDTATNITVFIGCSSVSNGTYGFNSSGTVARFIACEAFANTSGSYNFATTATDNVLVANYVNSTTTSLTDTDITATGNKQVYLKQERRILVMKNTSGGTVPEGAVVVFQNSAPSDEITTTTTNGDTKVFGMKAGAATPNNGSGDVLLEGTTTKLLVTNGATSISVGDWLSTYSHAYYAKAAVAGDMAFAIAMSAPTTSTAQISALLVHPRMI